MNILMVLRLARHKGRTRPATVKALGSKVKVLGACADFVSRQSLPKVVTHDKIQLSSAALAAAETVSKWGPPKFPARKKPVS